MILKGIVGHGKEKGRLIGFPTANLELEDGTDLKLSNIRLGVYASKVKVLGQVFVGITNVGQRPTADNDDTITIETYILSFSGDLYGEPMEVELCEYLRGLHKFESMKELAEQLKKDCISARQILSR